MEAWKLFKIELDKYDIRIDDTTVKQLAPMYRRWMEYIRETRKIMVDRETEPFADIQRSAPKGGRHAT
jgi:hypothetical protein